MKLLFLISSVLNCYSESTALSKILKCVAGLLVPIIFPNSKTWHDMSICFSVFIYLQRKPAHPNSPITSEKVSQKSFISIELIIPSADDTKIPSPEDVF